MPKKLTTGGIDAAEVARLLPCAVFVKRGDLAAAFGFSKTELAALIAAGVFVAHYPFGGQPTREKRAARTVVRGERARFLRVEVVAVAQRWEGGR